MLIYKWTSPSNKIYIGQTIHSLPIKYNWYKKCARFDSSNRMIFNAIRKYGIENMQMTIVEQSNTWTLEELNQKEIFYIKYYNSYYKYGNGYNMTKGGDGVDSETAKILSTQFHARMTPEQKAMRAKNCSFGQIQRYAISSDSELTRKKKKESHQKTYIIKDPDGKEYIAKNGLKNFAEDFGPDLGITYWQLFNAYRKTYTGQVNQKNYKNANKWTVIKKNE